MSEDSQRAWIETQLINRLGADYPSVKVDLNNVKFDPVDEEMYVSYVILAGDGKQGELAQKFFTRHVGVLQIDVMAPENTGTGPQTRLADYLVKLFSSRQTPLSDNSSLTFRVGASRYLGVSQGMARRSCRIPYWRDDPHGA